REDPPLERGDILRVSRTWRCKHCGAEVGNHQPVLVGGGGDEGFLSLTLLENAPVPLPNGNGRGIPNSRLGVPVGGRDGRSCSLYAIPPGKVDKIGSRSEEHTSELQSRENLVCRLLLEKKNQHT